MISSNDTRIRHELIKFRLRERGLSFSKLAELEGLHRSVLSAVSATAKKSYRAASLIADALETTPSELWPEIYGEGND